MDGADTCSHSSFGAPPAHYQSLNLALSCSLFFSGSLPLAFTHLPLALTLTHRLRLPLLSLPCLMVVLSRCSNIGETNPSYTSLPPTGKGAGGTPGTTQRGTGCLRFLQWLLYILTCLLFLLLLGFLAYQVALQRTCVLFSEACWLQCWVIYLPAMRSAIDPTFKPKFPAYTYSVLNSALSLLC